MPSGRGSIGSSSGAFLDVEAVLTVDEEDSSGSDSDCEGVGTIFEDEAAELLLLPPYVGRDDEA